MGQDQSKLLRQIRTQDEVAIYQIITTLGIDNEEIAIVSETAFQNDLADPRKGAEAASEIHEKSENW